MFENGMRLPVQFRWLGMSSFFISMPMWFSPQGRLGVMHAQIISDFHTTTNIELCDNSKSFRIPWSQFLKDFLIHSRSDKNKSSLIWNCRHCCCKPFLDIRGKVTNYLLTPVTHSPLFLYFVMDSAEPSESTAANYSSWLVHHNFAAYFWHIVTTSGCRTLVSQLTFPLKTTTLRIL